MPRPIIPPLNCCWLLFSAGLLLLSGVPAGAEEPNSSAKHFEHSVQPILVKYCTGCHGEKTRWAGLDLRTPQSIVQGGESGAAISVEKPAESLLLVRLLDGTMPPEDHPRPAAAEVTQLQAWIGTVTKEQFAALAAESRLTPEDAGYWAFQKLARPALPAVRELQRVRTPIDQFVICKLEANGLLLSPDVERLALLRRASFDLIGLPPTPEEIRAWLADNAPDAYDRLLDRLLASPHYGERWGRHWLDAAGYADTIKTDNDIGGGAIREGMWRYRDYVVQSLNQDKPYDLFVREQLAGDELTGLTDVSHAAPETITPEQRELLVATGMLRTSVDGTNNFERNRPQERFEVLFDTMENLTSNLLGLTMACARCHDHKFDPLTQRDYYGLIACLTPAYNPTAWVQPQFRHLVISTAAEIEELNKFNADLNRQAGELGGQLARLRKPYEEQVFEAKLAQLPAPIREDVRTALKTGVAQRTAVQSYLVEKFSQQLAVTSEEVTAALSMTDRLAHDDLQGQMDDLRARQRQPQKVQALFDMGPRPETHLFRRGDFESPGRVIQPAMPEVLNAGGLMSGVDAASTGNSGRRTALAQKLTEPGSRAAALLARVLVNRIWQHHFGRGIVATPGNFGRSGAAPTHPELLEWLATDFVEHGWQMKRLHKLIMQSSVYRQASAVASTPGAASSHSAATDPNNIDPENQLLWRMRLRRLESELVRDAILAVSGRLDRSFGGPPVLLTGRPDGTVVLSRHGHATPTSPQRRSLYLLARRNFNLSLLAVFDQPLMGTNCSERKQSVVVSQSLTLLNDAFVQEEAEHFAKRVLSESAGSDAGRIELAFQLALGRTPNEQEQNGSLEFLAKLTLEQEQENGAAGSADANRLRAWTYLCQMLLNTNEFLYIE